MSNAKERFLAGTILSAILIWPVYASPFGAGSVVAQAPAQTEEEKSPRNGPASRRDPSRNNRNPNSGRSRHPPRNVKCNRRRVSSRPRLRNNVRCSPRRARSCAPGGGWTWRIAVHPWLEFSKPANCHRLPRTSCVEKGVQFGQMPVCQHTQDYGQHQGKLQLREPDQALQKGIMGSEMVSATAGPMEKKTSTAPLSNKYLHRRKSI